MKTKFLCDVDLIFSNSIITVRFNKNVLQLLYIIAHEIIVSNSVSEYTHGPWKVSSQPSSLK